MVEGGEVEIAIGCVNGDAEPRGRYNFADRFPVAGVVEAVTAFGNDLPALVPGIRYTVYPFKRFPHFRRG